MAPRKPTGPTAGFDLEEMFRPFASMAPDWSKAMPAMGASAAVWQELAATHQRNLASLTKMNTGVATAMRQIAERQVELMRATMAELGKISESVQGGKGAAMAPDAMSAAFERALATMREIAEIAEKANREALAAITERSQEYQQELQALIGKAGKP